MRVKIQFRCEECKEKNYASTKNRRSHPSKLSMKKYCPRCGQHTEHKESK